MEEEEIMKHVRATNVSAITGIKIKELGRVASPGEEFDVTDSRFKTLSGNNMYHKVFVVLAEQPVDIEEEVKPKRTRKKTENA